MKPFSILDKVLTKNERRRLELTGIRLALKPKSNFTSLERKYYLMLKDLNVFYISQYPLDGRYFDAFLPDQKILLEFDGTFWHPKDKKDCKYGFQKKSMEVDKLKNEIAARNGFKIIRIREESPITSEQMKQLIKG